MGHAVSTLLEHDATARRVPSNAIENESRFAFCEQWTTTDVNEFLVTYTRLYHELQGTDVHKKQERQRELQVRISDIEAHLLVIHHEEEALTEENPPGNDIVVMRTALQVELTELKQELYLLQQLPAFESIDFNLPLHWGAFLKSVRHIEMEAKFGAMLRKRSSWHISTLGYEMNRDPRASEELQRYAIELDKYKAPKANHEIDGHTDDNASDSENGSIQDEEVDEDTDAKKDDKVKPSLLTAVALEPLAALPPPLPPMFDPSLRSPVFFGYTTEKAVSPVDVAKESSAALEAQEMKYFEARIAKANKRHEEATAIEKGKLKSLLDRRNTTLEKRTKVHASRDKEIEEAKKEGVDPTADFFRKMEVSGIALKEEEDREDALFASQHEAILGRMEKSAKDHAQELELFMRMQAGASPPIAPLRRNYHEAQLSQLTSALTQARVDLEQAAKTLEETKARVASTPTPDTNAAATRTQLLFANDQVIAAEKLIANIVAQINQEEFMLKRADDMRVIEAHYLPVFTLLVSTEGKVESMMQATALLLVLAIHGSSLTQKLKYIFQLNIGTAGRIEKETLTALLKLFFTLLDTMKEFKMPKLSAEAWSNLGERACVSPMTWYDFKTFCIDGIERSQTLSTYFQVPWKLANLSRITLQSMTPLHQYELGIISLSDLKFALAKQQLKSRTELAPHRRETLHIRALSMGANDPLKTDYSKYLKQRKTKVLSNAVPLDHGGYRNLLVYRAEVAKKAAIRLQTTWRAKKGRHDAYMAAKKQAFYHAKGTALMEARQSVEKEWQKLETTKETTIEKMKFDAKIRMRQVKLRTKGLTMDRRQVLLVMTEEAVQDALEEIDHRFREMEEDAGYVPVCLRFDPLNMDHFAEISTALIDQLKRARLPTLETANLLKRIAEKDKVEQPEAEAEKPAAAPPPVLKNTQVSPKHFISSTALEAKKSAIESRHLAMMQGKCPPYNELSSIEKRVWLALASSSPDLEDWIERLQYICIGLTEFKLNEFLLELPSKRHAMEYTMVFRRPPNPTNRDTIEFDRDALITDLQAHFRIVRGVENLADSLISMAASDIENQLGFLTSKVLERDEAFLESHVVKLQMRAALITQKERKRKGNVGGKDMLQRLEFEQKHQLQLVHEAKSKADEAIAKWKHAQLSLDLLETKLHTASMEMVPKLTSLTDRTQWAERLKRAIEASGEAWIEVFHVSQDFVHTAQQVAVQIAREYFVPLHMKSILPLSTPEFKIEGRDDGSVRSSKGRGLRFEVHNIRFQVVLDDHGRYDNCDEFAMKAAAAEIRNSSLFLPLLMATPSILVPLSCIVDYLGLRVLCVAKLPIERYDINDRGIIQNTYTEFVYGCNNHGRTVIHHSKSLDGAVRKANGYLNLTSHGVRGAQDLTAKMISGVSDMHGYVGRDEWLCLLRFRRSMPPEDPEETRHLPSSTRGLSILWRQLRPALVQSQPEPLSSDALSFMTNNAPDWEIHTNRVKAATIHLLDEVIPAFARKLATRPDYVLAQSFALTPELHRHGINVRHLGYLRHQFRYQLSGTAAMTFNSNIISTTEDMTREIQRGDTIYIHGEAYQISLLSDDKVSSNTLTVDRPYKGDSTQGVAVYTGGVIDAFNCVRELLLIEMIQRCIKNLLRSALRSFLRSRQLAIGPNHTALIVSYLNYISGASDGAHSFWDVHVFEGIRIRFGPIAVSFVERLNLRRAPVAIVKYLCESIGFELTPSCWKSFELHPEGFLFSIDDLLSPNNLEAGGTGCRVKHNLSILHFAAASLLLERASLIQGTTYQAGILLDQPCGYWPLNERRGATVAKNLGSSSDHGKFSKSCILEAPGPIANDDLCRAINFPNASQAHITCSKAKKWENAITLEAWVCPHRDGSGIRAIISHGRCTLAILKDNTYGAWVNLNNIDVVVTGCSVSFDKWAHVACTFDGTTLLLFVDSVLYGDFDVRSQVDYQLKCRDIKFTNLRANLDEQEEVAKNECFRQVERECRLFFNTKEGKKLVSELAKKVKDEHAFKERLNRKGSQQNNLAPEGEPQVNQVKKPAKLDFEVLAKQQHTAALYQTKVDAVVEAFKKLRLDLNNKIEQELEDEKFKEARPCRIGCVANASSNSKYFVGALAHVAYYTKALDRDVIFRHYLLGTRDRAHTADRLFELSATRFTRALAYSPEDKTMLASYATNICSALKYDLDHRTSQEMYKLKVRRALSVFKTRENALGCAEILRNLPRDIRFSDLFREAYSCVNELSPTYWTPDPGDTSKIALLQLAAMPIDFFLSGNSKQSSLKGLLIDEIKVFADVIRRVVAVYPTHYGDGLTDLKWLIELVTPSVVVYFVMWLVAGEDGRRFDLSFVPDITHHDLDIITASIRSALAFNLAKCMNVTDKGVCLIALRCCGIEELNFTGISHLTDASIIALAKTCRNLKSLVINQCGLITDISIEALEQCMNLRELGLNECGKLTDDSLMAIARAHPRLTRLEVSFCIQFSDFEAFAKLSNAVGLTWLNVSGCRRLKDNGIIEMCKKFTKLTTLNLAYCDKLTDRGIWAATHNCLGLVELNLQELYLLTDKVFTFDHEGDGRANVAKTMLSQLKTIVLADCKGLSDTGIAYLHHRARQLESFDASGCINATTQTLKYMTIDVYNSTVVGEYLRVLDLSFCMNLTGAGLDYIKDRCKQLVTIFVTGCVYLNDENIVGLVKSCTKLTRIGLGYCRDITDAVLFAIADSLYVETLSLTRCPKITDSGLCAVANQCNAITALSIGSCKRITNASMQELWDNCNKLLELDVTYCPLITWDALEKFATKRLGMQLRSDFDRNGKLDDEVIQERLFRQNSKQLLLPPVVFPSPRTPATDEDDNI